MQKALAFVPESFFLLNAPLLWIASGPGHPPLYAHAPVCFRVENNNNIRTCIRNVCIILASCSFNLLSYAINANEL